MATIKDKYLFNQSRSCVWTVECFILPFRKKSSKKKARVFADSWRVPIVQGYRAQNGINLTKDTHCAEDKKSPFFYNNF